MDKAPDAYRTISEVGEDLDIAQHVLRFWETRFPQIKPLKRGGGRRYYRPDDVELLKGIRHLLYREGYTIKGVQRILKEQGPRGVQAVGKAGGLVPGLAPAYPDELEPVPRAPLRADYSLPPAPLPDHRSAAGFGDFASQSAFEAELPLEQPAPPRPFDGQVSFTRGGIGARHDLAPTPASISVPAEGGSAARLALVEALGELESARAAIGRILANRERANAK